MKGNIVTEPASSAAGGWAIGKAIGGLLAIGVVASALGFMVLLPKTPKEAAMRILATMAGSALLGPLMVAAAYSRHPEVFSAGATLAQGLGMEAWMGTFMVAAPLLALAGLPCWWIRALSCCGSRSAGSRARTSARWRPTRGRTSGECFRDHRPRWLEILSGLGVRPSRRRGGSIRSRTRCSRRNSPMASATCWTCRRSCTRARCWSASRSGCRTTRAHLRRVAGALHDRRACGPIRVQPGEAGELRLREPHGQRAAGDRDGYRYRGRSPIQLTGRAAYAHVGDLVGQDLLEVPELACECRYGLEIAIAWWEDRIPDEMLGDQVRLRRRVNGGTLGLEHVAGLRVRLSEMRRERGLQQAAPLGGK